MKNIILLFSTILFSLLLTNINAQEAIPASGGNSIGNGGSVSFTMGQILYSSHNIENGSLTEGVQQSYEIVVVSSSDDYKAISSKYNVYPNPTTNFLQLEVDGPNSQNLSYRLYDQNGKLIESTTVKSHKTIIEMRRLSPATYFLHIAASSLHIKTFKIIKK